MRARVAAVIALALSVATLVCAVPARAQLYFGQNLVQYDRLDWRVIETEHFLVHYYPVERIAAHDAARLAERSYARLSRLLQHQFREKKPIIVFQSRGDFAQSNVFGDLGEGTGRRHRHPAPAHGAAAHRRLPLVRARADARDGAPVPVRHLRARDARARTSSSTRR